MTEAQDGGKIIGAKEKLSKLVGKPNGTYDLETGERVPLYSGYQVSFQQTSDNYTDEEYDDKVNELMQRTGSIAYGGVFGGEPEISFHTTSLKEAMEIAFDYNQHSIWDWSANDGEGDLIINPDYDPSKGNKIGGSNE